MKWAKLVNLASPNIQVGSEAGLLVCPLNEKKLSPSRLWEIAILSFTVGQWSMFSFPTKKEEEYI